MELWHNVTFGVVRKNASFIGSGLVVVYSVSSYLEVVVAPSTVFCVVAFALSDSDLNGDDPRSVSFLFWRKLDSSASNSSENMKYR